MTRIVLLAIGCGIASILVLAVAIVAERYIERCEASAEGEHPRQTTADVLRFTQRVERRRREIRQTTKGGAA